MLKVIRERGFADGFKAGRKKKQESLGLSIKQLVNLVFVKDDREIAKQFMKEINALIAKARNSQRGGKAELLFLIRKIQK